jgi:hypothetical protein
MTTHYNHNRQTSLSSVGFEPAIPESEQPQTQGLDRAATELWTIGKNGQQVLHDSRPENGRNSEGKNHNK